MSLKRPHTGRFSVRFSVIARSFDTNAPPHPVHEPERGALGAVAHADLLPLGLCRLVNLVLGHLTQVLSPLHAALAAARAARTLACCSAVREQLVLRVAALVGWQRLRRGELLPGRLACRAAEVSRVRVRVRGWLRTGAWVRVGCSTVVLSKATVARAMRHPLRHEIVPRAIHLAWKVGTWVLTCAKRMEGGRWEGGGWRVEVRVAVRGRG